jgi:cytochrome c553
MTQLAEYYGGASLAVGDERFSDVGAAAAARGGVGAAAATFERDAEEAARVDAAAERGRRIASAGIPARDIAACAYCHGPDRVARNPLFPPLAGQPLRYLEEQLELWVREGGRGGTPYAHVMQEAAKELRPQEIRDVAAYYARLPVEDP